MTAAPVANAEVVRIFRRMADLLELRDANPFRVRAYRNAARTVEGLADSVADLATDGIERLDALPGIGEDLAGKIAEIVRTGRLRALDDLERSSPAGGAEILSVRGIGPRRARALIEELGIHTIDELAAAARKGRVRDVRGFGRASEAAVLREVRARAADGRRFRRAEVEPYAEDLAARIEEAPGVRAVHAAGSYRRWRETVGDLDLLATAARKNEAVARFTSHRDVVDVLERGTTRASVRLRSGLRVDLRVLAPPSEGAGLLYFTGSKAHVIAVRRIAQDAGLKMNEYGVYRGKKRVAGRTERECYAALGLAWIPPELRENRGEIDAARTGGIPRLVETKDLRGDLHVHTTDSDGRDDLEAMARAAEERGLEYVAITDHSPAVRVAGGMTRRGFRAQMRRIDALNAKLRSLTLLKGAEVDVREDGTLDLDERTRADLDVVLIALHSKLDLPREKQTERVLRALSQPAVDVLAHPTGRLLARTAHRPARSRRPSSPISALGPLDDATASPARPRLDLDEDGSTIRTVRNSDRPRHGGNVRWGRRLRGTAREVCEQCGLERRRGADLDLHRALAVAADHGVMLEVDSQPERLDLDDAGCRAAAKRGVLLSIASDAHAAKDLDLVRHGVAQARRGWVERRHVANALPLRALRTRLHRER